MAAPVNRLIGQFQHVILTQDWHPARHRSFASAHPGHKPFEPSSAFMENDKTARTGLTGYLRG